MLKLIKRRRLNRRFLGYAGKTGAIGVLLATVSVAAVGKERLPTLTQGTLRIGTYFVNPPFAKKNSTIVMAVNQVIAAMQRDGSLQRLKEKWTTNGHE